MTEFVTQQKFSHLRQLCTAVQTQNKHDANLSGLLGVRQSFFFCICCLESVRKVGQIYEKLSIFNQKLCKTLK